MMNVQALTDRELVTLAAELKLEIARRDREDGLGEGLRQWSVDQVGAQPAEVTDFHRTLAAGMMGADAERVAESARIELEEMENAAAKVHQDM